MTVPAQLTSAALGEGVVAAHEDGALGSVVGTFRHGCYVQVDTQTYAVAGPSVSAGPIHLILSEQPPATSEGQAVWRQGHRLRSTAWEVDLAEAPRFDPWLPELDALVRAGPLLTRMLERLAVPTDLGSHWQGVGSAVAAGDLDAARALLEGRGGGLTPTGDDVLAGVLLVHAWCGGDRRDLAEHARRAATTNLSRSFLAWAARGQSLAPVHDLVAYASDGNAAGFEERVATVSAIGGSSGTALLWGVGLAAAAAVSRARAAVDRTARSSP